RVDIWCEVLRRYWGDAGHDPRPQHRDSHVASDARGTGEARPVLLSEARASMHAHRDMLQALPNRNAPQSGDADPQVPDAITNARAIECWEPLWALADLAEGDWPERSRAVA